MASGSMQVREAGDGQRMPRNVGTCVSLRSAGAVLTSCSSTDITRLTLAVLALDA